MMGLAGKAIAIAAGAALFTAGYVSGCSSTQDKDYRLFREEKNGIEQVYLQDKQNPTDVYGITRTDSNGLKFEDYSVDIHIRDTSASEVKQGKRQESNARSTIEDSLD
ncbi:hypothetical protein GF345_01660 [Candidatus Woesearchaeota archaeon]|nr:hypothetical protein [Candidatus Woesearchaeota archaeon]